LGDRAKNGRKIQDMYRKVAALKALRQGCLAAVTARL
jgi:hypothetical protein